SYQGFTARRLGLDNPDVKRLLDRGLIGRLNSRGNYLPRLEGIDYAVYPQPGRRVIWCGLCFVPFRDFRQQAFFFGLVDLLSLGFHGCRLDLQQGLGGLRTAHNGDFCRWPRKDQPRIVRLAAHGIVARSVGIADDNGKLRDDRIGHRIYHLGAILNDAAMFRTAAYHKTGDVLEKDQGDFLLVAIHDEARGLVGGIRIDDAAKLHFALLAFNDLTLVGDNANGPSIDPRQTANDALAI